MDHEILLIDLTLFSLCFCCVTLLFTVLLIILPIGLYELNVLHFLSASVPVGRRCFTYLLREKDKILDQLWAQMFSSGCLETHWGRILPAVVDFLGHPSVITVHTCHWRSACCSLSCRICVPGVTPEFFLSGLLLPVWFCDQEPWGTTVTLSICTRRCAFVLSLLFYFQRKSPTWNTFCCCCCWRWICFTNVDSYVIN